MNSFKQQCIALRREDYTLNEIVRLTGRPKTSVYVHIKDIPLSKKKLREISENSSRAACALADARKGIALRPHKPFTEWTPPRVLLVAHMLFDGELKKSCVYNNRSDALISRVERLMKDVYDYPPLRHLNNVTGVYRISYHNVALSAHLKERSCELMCTIMDMSSDHQREFLRAFFDDEGCMDYRIKSNVRRIRGYQKDRKILTLVQQLLAQFDIESSLRGKNEVVIMGKDNLKIFQKEINFSPGVCINDNRTNSIWKQPLEKREILKRAIESFKK